MGRKSDLRILGANRREWLIRAGATAVAGVLPTPSFAQPKVAPPTIIKAGSFVMSINPTLPPPAIRKRQRRADGPSPGAR
jgi:hypothetical protein